MVERFTGEQSIGFLKMGFREANMAISDDILENIVDGVDGIVSWLTYFGYMGLKSGSALKDPVREVRDILAERGYKYHANTFLW